MKQPFGGRVTRYAFLFAALMILSAFIPVLYLLFLYLGSAVNWVGMQAGGSDSSETLLYSHLAGLLICIFLLLVLGKYAREKAGGRFILIGWHFFVAIFLLGIITAVNAILGTPVNPESGIYFVPLLVLGGIYSVVLIGLSYIIDMAITYRVGRVG